MVTDNGELLMDNFNKGDSMTNDNITYWTNGTTNNMYSFNNFNRRGPLTANFMKFVESCEKYGKPATKRAFYKIMNRELLPGNNNTFFMAIKTAGIVTATKEWNGSFTECVYTKGPNWNVYLNNNLRCNNR